MQGYVVELIRELMHTQQMSIRKISAQIARKHGGSALGYTQQINRILNDPAYDPTFSTVEKILAALNCSLWQTASIDQKLPLEHHVEQLSCEVADVKVRLDRLCHLMSLSVENLSTGVEATTAASNLPLPELHSNS